MIGKQDEVFSHSCPRLQRRSFLKSILGYGTTLACTPAWTAVTKRSERALNLYSLHTGETVKTTYWQEGNYLPESLQQLNRLLRDHRNGAVREMDTQLLDLLFLIQQQVRVKGTYSVISGYRSPETNRKLRALDKDVAKDSLHMQGKAIDIRLPGCELQTLRKAALSLKAGGVGFYTKSNFLHIDTGDVRSW